MGQGSESVSESSVASDEQPKMAWERPVIKTFEMTDVTLGAGRANGEGIANVS